MDITTTPNKGQVYAQRDYASSAIFQGTEIPVMTTDEAEEFKLGATKHVLNCVEGTVTAWVNDEGAILIDHIQAIPEEEIFGNKGQPLMPKVHNENQLVTDPIIWETPPKKSFKWKADKRNKFFS